MPQVAFFPKELDRGGIHRMPSLAAPVSTFGKLSIEVRMIVELSDLDVAWYRKSPIELCQDEGRAPVEIVDIFRHARHSTPV